MIYFQLIFLAVYVAGILLMIGYNLYNSIDCYKDKMPILGTLFLSFATFGIFALTIGIHWDKVIEDFNTLGI